MNPTSRSISQRPPPEQQSNSFIPTVPLWTATNLSNAGARASLRCGIFAGVDTQLEKHCGIPPWFLSTRGQRKAAFGSNLVDVIDALYDLDLRHDPAIMAFIGPIETYTQDDDNPQNAEVITFLSRSIQQSTSPTVQRIVAHAREDFLNGIARPHGVDRDWRLQDYQYWKQQYEEVATGRLDNGLPQDENPGPWAVNTQIYRSQLSSTVIGDLHLDNIDPLVNSTHSARGRTNASTLPASPAPTCSSPTSVAPVPAAAPPSQSSQSLTQRLTSLSLNEVVSYVQTDGTNVDHERWGVPVVPEHYSVSLAIDFVLAAQGVALPKIAMVKCVLGDVQLGGEDCLTKLEEILLDFAMARIVAYLAGRLANRQ